MRKRDMFFYAFIFFMFFMSACIPAADEEKRSQAASVFPKETVQNLPVVQEQIVEMQCTEKTDSDSTYTPYKEGYNKSFNVNSLFISGEIFGTDKKDYCEDANVTEYYCGTEKEYGQASFSCQEYCLGKECACSLGACRVLAK